MVVGDINTDFGYPAVTLACGNRRQRSPTLNLAILFADQTTERVIFSIPYLPVRCTGLKRCFTTVESLLVDIKNNGSIRFFQGSYHYVAVIIREVSRANAE
jgi:hypothetical protein